MTLASSLRVPSHVGWWAVYGVWSSTLALIGYYGYERFWNHDPMQLKRDADGVWRWKTLEEYFEEKAAVRAGASAGGSRGGGGGRRRVATCSLRIGTAMQRQLWLCVCSGILECCCWLPAPPRSTRDATAVAACAAHGCSACTAHGCSLNRHPRRPPPTHPFAQMTKLKIETYPNNPALRQRLELWERGVEHERAKRLAKTDAGNKQLGRRDLEL